MAKVQIALRTVNYNVVFSIYFLNKGSTKSYRKSCGPCRFSIVPYANAVLRANSRINKKKTTWPISIGKCH